MLPIAGLKYRDEYSVLLLQGISQTTNWQQFFKLKEQITPNGCLFMASLTYKNCVFKVRPDIIQTVRIQSTQEYGNTKKSAQRKVAEALIGYFNITDEQIKEMAIAVFNQMKKEPNSILGETKIETCLDPEGNFRSTYKDSDTTLTNVRLECSHLFCEFMKKTQSLTQKFRSKKAAEKEMGFILLGEVWEEMRIRFEKIKPNIKVEKCQNFDEKKPQAAHSLPCHIINCTGCDHCLPFSS